MDELPFLFFDERKTFIPPIPNSQLIFFKNRKASRFLNRAYSSTSCERSSPGEKVFDKRISRAFCNTENEERIHGERRMISVQAGQHSSRSSRKFLLSRSGKSESEVEERLSVCQLLDKRLQPRERISSIISDANERRERERERRISYARLVSPD